MTYTELQERCKNRVYDQIVLVTDDIFTQSANLVKVYHLEPSDMAVASGTAVVDGAEVPYTEYRVSGFIGEMELRIVQPVAGETIYRKYLDRFGTGLCNLRERIPAAEYDAFAAQCDAKGIKVGQEEGKCRILDLMDEMGILYTICSDDVPTDVKKPAVPNDRRILQINITCGDVEALADQLAGLLEIGPYEIGHINNQTVGDLGILVDGKMGTPEFEYLLGMNCCGNLEIETISPVKGPNCFADFAAKRPTGGYNHLKECAPLTTGKWQEEVKHYEDLGFQQCIKGKIGPCGWCFFDTMDTLGFLVELGDGVPMTQLPEGYDAYFIPEKDAAAQ